ncbi:MAG: HIT family protein [Corallococcus sp.]|nr:HIT family protein [Corallococcus sp.]
MKDCIFCKIVKGEIPSFKIYEDDYVYAFLDIARDLYGHTLVIPKKHCQSVLDADEQTLNAVICAVNKIALHYINDCGFTGVNIMNASGASAQQSVFHLHFHVIPRKDNDGVDAWPFKEQDDYDLEAMRFELALTK